jgi:KAP family P-loop domain
MHDLVADFFPRGPKRSQATQSCCGFRDQGPGCSEGCVRCWRLSRCWWCMAGWWRLDRKVAVPDGLRWCAAGSVAWLVVAWLAKELGGLLKVLLLWIWCPPAPLGDVEIPGSQANNELPVEARNANEKDPLRFVVFVDDLDRCKPSEVVAILEAINLVLAASGRFFIVTGVDRRKLVQAVCQHYCIVDGSGRSIPRDSHFGDEFLRKIYQVSLAGMTSDWTHKDQG